MILISKLPCILICILVTVVLNAPIKNSPSTVETMLDHFINSLPEMHCAIPRSVVLPSYPKMNTPQYDDGTPQPYDLGIPLEICMIPISSKSSNDFRAWKLCDEVFKVIINMSSCKLTEEKLESIKYDINLPVSNDSCKDYPKHKTIFPTDEKYLASKLTNEMICRLVCDGEVYEKACSFLLWAYQVQHKLVAETSFITQNISKQKPDLAVITTLSINPSQHNSENLIAPPENATADTNETLNEITEEGKTKKLSQDAKERDNEISEEAKAKKLPQDATSSSGKIKALKEGEKNIESDIKNKTHSVIENQTETKNGNSHSDFNAAINQATDETSSVVAETSFITQNISKQKPDLAVITTLSINPSQHNSENLIAPPENATADTNETLNEITEEGKTKKLSQDAKERDNEISEEAKAKKLPQDATSSSGKIKALKEGEKNIESDIKNKTHSVIENQTETKNGNSHSDFNAAINQATNETSSVGKMKPSVNTNAKDNTDSKTKIIPTRHSEKNEKSNSSSENMTDTLSVKKVSSIVYGQLNNENKTSVSSSMKVTNEGLSKNTAVTKSSTLSTGKFANKKVENAQTLANTASPIPNEEIAVEKMESDNNEIPLPPGDEQEHYIDTENEGDIEGEFPRSEYDSSNNDAGNDENQKSKPDQSVDHQLNDMPGDDEDHIPVITENGSDRMQDEAIDTQAIARNQGAFSDQEDNHFFFYFLSIIVVCIAGYLVFHNKQKIIALIIEGRHERRRRSSSHGVNYKKLEAK